MKYTAGFTTTLHLHKHVSLCSCGVAAVWIRVWGKQLCTLGVAGCVCLLGGLWIHLLFTPVDLLHECGWLLQCCLISCVHWSGGLKGCFWIWLEWLMTDVQTTKCPWKSYSSESLASDKKNVSGRSSETPHLHARLHTNKTTRATITGQSGLDKTQTHAAHGRRSLCTLRDQSEQSDKQGFPTYRSGVSSP